MFSAHLPAIVGVAVRTVIDLHILKHFTPAPAAKVIEMNEEVFAGIRDDILEAAEKVDGGAVFAVPPLHRCQVPRA